MYEDFLFPIMLIPKAGIQKGGWVFVFLVFFCISVLQLNRLSRFFHRWTHFHWFDFVLTNQVYCLNVCRLKNAIERWENHGEAFHMKHLSFLNVSWAEHLHVALMELFNNNANDTWCWTYQDGVKWWEPKERSHVCVASLFKKKAWLATTRLGPIRLALFQNTWWYQCVREIGKISTINIFHLQR